METLKLGKRVKAKTKYGWMDGIIIENKRPNSYTVQARNGKEYAFRRFKVFPDDAGTRKLIDVEKLITKVKKEVEKNA